MLFCVSDVIQFVSFQGMYQIPTESGSCYQSVLNVSRLGFRYDSFLSLQKIYRMRTEIRSNLFIFAFQCFLCSMSVFYFSDMITLFFARNSLIAYSNCSNLFRSSYKRVLDESRFLFRWKGLVSVKNMLRMRTETCSDLSRSCNLNCFICFCVIFQMLSIGFCGRNI